MCSPHTHTFVPSPPLSTKPSDACCPLGNAAGTVVGVGISQDFKVPGAARGQNTQMRESLREDMAATLLTVMFMIPYICEGGEMFL